ncbi:drebrin-like protein [Agrilus planipennis]|uniref:Drebrin-like protein n=1 Tax=Agrilus planipennis TaxID=224129 RepID=A0A1W4XEU5_AGRPL|nr:drebrin-like protein [Agrilus planipennis]
MSLNLSRYRDTLLHAWKEVLDDKNETNWALFGYEGQTNTLKVVSTGSGGIEELTEELNSGKIMYAFLKITDPKTSLPKYALINWQGEGAHTLRKGMCANHLRDIENFFKGAHLTINARSEDDLDSQTIVDKLAKSGSAIKLITHRSEISDVKTPVGTNYKKVNPVAEINSNERDQFWQKEEQEEKKRKEEERKRKEHERQIIEEEFKQRGIHEGTEWNNKTDVFSQNDEKDYAKSNPSPRKLVNTSIFEQSAVQVKKIPEKPVRSSLLKSQTQPFSQTSVEVNPTCTQEHVSEPLQQKQQITESKSFDEGQSDEDSDQFSTIKRSPRDPQKNVNTDKDKSLHNTEFIQQITEQQFVDEVIYQDLVEGPGLQARALYDYQAADDTEITFDPGDIITNIDQVDEGWWQGLGPDGTYGLFPANYVELIN